MNFNLKEIILFLIIFSNCVLYSISGRDFSENLIQDYQQLVKNKMHAKTSKSIACANLDILILLMPEAANFDLITMQSISGNPSLFLHENFYKDWKLNLIGKTHSDNLDKEIIKLENLENIKLLDKDQSDIKWANLIQNTEEIIQEVGKTYGYKLILKQNTIVQPYSFQNLGKYSIISRNIPNITPIIAKHILKKRNLTPIAINKIIKSIEQKFIF